MTAKPRHTPASASPVVDDPFRAPTDVGRVIALATFGSSAILSREARGGPNPGAGPPLHSTLGVGTGVGAGVAIGHGRDRKHGVGPRIPFAATETEDNALAREIHNGRDGGCCRSRNNGNVAGLRLHVSAPGNSGELSASSPPTITRRSIDGRLHRNLAYLHVHG